MGLKSGSAASLLGAFAGVLSLSMSLRTTHEPYSYGAGQRNEEAVLAYLRPALDSAGKVGRLYYGAVCESKAPEVPPFPAINVRPPLAESRGLAAIRDIFRNDKDVVVTERSPGVVAVTIGKPPLVLLRTEIAVLSLKPLEQYNPTLAIGAIENTREVREAMRSLRVQLPPISFDQLLTRPNGRAPHLSSLMKDVTVDHALDSLAVTFGGIVVYGACTGGRGKASLWLDFVGGRIPRSARGSNR